MSDDMRFLFILTNVCRPTLASRSSKFGHRQLRVGLRPSHIKNCLSANPYYALRFSALLEQSSIAKILLDRLYEGIDNVVRTYPIHILTCDFFE